MFTRNYGKFCDILKNEDGLLDKFVEKKIISYDQAVVLRDAPITRKGQDFLINISGPLDGGQTKGFYIMLEIMKEHGRIGTQDFAADIEQQLQDRADIERQVQDHTNVERQLQDYAGAIEILRNNQEGQEVITDKVYVKLQDCKQVDGAL